MGKSRKVGLDQFRTTYRLAREGREEERRRRILEGLDGATRKMYEADFKFIFQAAQSVKEVWSDDTFFENFIETLIRLGAGVSVVNRHKAAYFIGYRWRKLGGRA